MMTDIEAAMQSALIDIHEMSTQETSRMMAQVRERATLALEELLRHEQLRSQRA